MSMKKRKMEKPVAKSVFINVKNNGDLQAKTKSMGEIFRASFVYKVAWWEVYSEYAERTKIDKPSWLLVCPFLVLYSLLGN